MQITDILAQTGGLQSMARELGVSESEAASGAAALLPAVLGGFKKQAQTQPGGLEGLGSLLGRLGGGSLLDDVLSPEPTNVNRGNEVLGKIFGSKDVSRAVAADAAPKSGLSADLLKKMLPIVAMAVAGYLAKQRAGSPVTPPSGTGGPADLLGKMFGRKEEAPSAAPRAGSPGLSGMLDLDGDGNPLDDILRMAGKVFR
jgi:hypothetical protein